MDDNQFAFEVMKALAQTKHFSENTVEDAIAYIAFKFSQDVTTLRVVSIKDKVITAMALTEYRKL